MELFEKKYLKKNGARFIKNMLKLYIVGRVIFLHNFIIEDTI